MNLVAQRWHHFDDVVARRQRHRTATARTQWFIAGERIAAIEHRIARLVEIAQTVIAVGQDAVLGDKGGSLAPGRVGCIPTVGGGHGHRLVVLCSGRGVDALDLAGISGVSQKQPDLNAWNARLVVFAAGKTGVGFCARGRVANQTRHAAVFAQGIGLFAPIQAIGHAKETLDALSQHRAGFSARQVVAGMHVDRRRGAIGFKLGLWCCDPVAGQGPSVVVQDRSAVVNHGRHARGLETRKVDFSDHPVEKREDLWELVAACIVGHHRLVHRAVPETDVDGLPCHAHRARGAKARLGRVLADFAFHVTKPVEHRHVVQVHVALRVGDKVVAGKDVVQRLVPHGQLIAGVGLGARDGERAVAVARTGKHGSTTAHRQAGRLVQANAALRDRGAVVKGKVGRPAHVDIDHTAVHGAGAAQRQRVAGLRSKPLADVVPRGAKFLEVGGLVGLDPGVIALGALDGGRLHPHARLGPRCQWWLAARAGVVAWAFVL